MRRILSNCLLSDFESFFDSVSESAIMTALKKERLSDRDLLALLSPAAEKFSGLISERSKKLTLRHFGRTISIYAPLYLSNYCCNECIYCGFRRSANISRRRLDGKELDSEAAILRESGIRHLLLLTGESRSEAPIEYIADCVRRLRPFFDAISIEVYPMETEEYRSLVACGVDGLTLYQETYDRELYAEYHRSGAKRDFDFRLGAPERAAEAGMRFVGVGALLGLADFRKDAFFTALHARQLLRKFPSLEIGLSVPRIDPRTGFNPPFHVSVEDLRRIMDAFRIFIPSASISLSTRESAETRDSLVGSAVTRMSAGSRTEVGGYALTEKSGPQFTPNDCRNVSEIVSMISSKGYDPVFTDWRSID